MVEQIDATLELDCLITELEDRINDDSLLPFVKDREFALGLLEQLRWLGPSGRDALLALDTLVPNKNPDGTRQIADRRISRKLEEIIASRYEAEEIDVAAPDGPWGSVPPVIRRLLWDTNNIGFYFEMTDRCTVMCDFCGFADKGKITQKASFASILQVIRDYHQGALRDSVYITATPSDAFYGGSDPFDGRWFDPDSGCDLDYGDLLEEYDKICGRRRISFTSTGVPIGEELRVLRVFLWFLYSKNNKSINHHSVFRFSQTDINQARVSAIMTIAESMYGKDLDPLGVHVTGNLSQRPFLAGKKTVKPKESVSFADIIGVNCKDGINLTLRGLEYVTMAGTSSERPRGEEIGPVMTKEDDGSFKYWLPYYYFKPDDFFSEDPRSFYPDAKVLEVTIDRTGKEEVLKRITNDPHRSFLRLAAVGYHYLSRSGTKKWNEDKLNRDQRRELASIVAHDLSLVKKHLQTESGSDNEMMWAIYEFFKRVL